ncbi:DUF924 domain-containing protein [Rhodobacteraceae bacterium]|nr:DUF924 domain-containing protein [Paracoccaceae bacterium]
MQQVTNVVTFWRDIAGPERWFESDPELDLEIRRRFARLWQKARVGTLDSWTETPTGTLALLIVLDQFPRHMFRDTADAWVSDAQACIVARHAIASGQDLQIDAPLRQFFYRPLLHSEEASVQSEGLELVAHRLPQGAMPEARARSKVIAQFGRFPWRNGIAGRSNTAEETAFLWQGGYMQACLAEKEAELCRLQQSRGLMAGPTSAVEAV